MAWMTEWLSERWIDIFYAIIFAIAAGILIHYIYIKIKPEQKILGKTIPFKPGKVLAKLVLPNNIPIKITDGEKILGREDFMSVYPIDDLMVIGKKHFKIIKTSNGTFIEDLKSQNGTKLNGEVITGSERKILTDGDEIIIADMLKLEYKEEMEEDISLK